MRPKTSKSSKKISTQKAKTKKSGASGKGKWIMKVGNVAKFLSVSITELIVKTPKGTLDIKEFKVDISKYGGSKPGLVINLHLIPILVHLAESQFSSDQASDHISSLSSSQTFATSERNSAPFSCEKFSLLCEFGHDSEAGVFVRTLNITKGKVAINLNDEMVSGKKGATEAVPRADEVAKETSESDVAKKAEKKDSFSAITKYTSMIPEKFSFTLSKLDVKFVHREHGVTVDNNITGFALKSRKSRGNEDVGECTRLNIQMEFREIHLLREAGISVVEIMKLAIVSSAYIPLQPSTSIRSEIDVKLGGIQCNLIISRFIQLMKLRSMKKKKTVPREESTTLEKPKSSGHKNFMWTCTVSAPDMTVVLYSLSGSPLYHCCLQSSNVLANNTSSTGTAVHMKLGELNLHLSDEYQECVKESMYGVEANNGPLVHVAKIILDLGKKDMDSPDEGLRDKKVFSGGVSGMSICLTFKRLESLISTAFSFKALLKSLSTSGKKPSQDLGPKSSKPSGKGIQHVKFNLERCSLNIYGEVGLENTVVPDPKRVNYGSQGGRVLITVCADGTPRTATIMSTASDECKKLKYSTSLDIFHLRLSMNKEKQSMQVDLETARSVFQEFLEDGCPGSKITLLDMQNAKFVRRSGVKETAVCSLFSATDISVRWEPDVQIALVELGLHLKLLVHKQKLEGLKNEHDLSSVRDDEKKKEIPSGPGRVEKQHKKKESIFAVDVEMLRISAEVGDGVETTVEVQSIFSENARIGVLLEGVLLSLNEARLIKSGRLQISRVPNIGNSASTVKGESVTVWDWVIRALDIHICVPYRLQLRAIDDAVEEMLRALKLITAGKTQLICPIKKESTKPKKPSSSRIGCLRLCIRKLNIDLEEEPMQGWLDEHYQLMKNEARELAVRLNFLDELISKGSQCPGSDETIDSNPDTKIPCNGDDIDQRDTSALEKLREDIYKQSFRSYYQACQNLVPSEGSGACKEGFQAGFKPSTNRTFLFRISATELDVRLTRIEGGDAGMIEVLQKLDPVCRARNIPFSRLYGGNLKLDTGSLVVQLRNYSYPLFSGKSGKCEGRLVLAQQATSFQPQMSQNVYVGKWRKVQMLRSLTGTTPPMKTFFDLPLHFQQGDISFGVGVEPSFTDLSYVFTVALRRANLSTRNPNPDVPPPKKEKSLPWWDDMRNYIHGNISLCFAETILNILATTDPYEKCDKLQISTSQMEIHQSDGRIYASVKDFKVFLSSLDSLLKNSSLKPVTEFPSAFLEAPILTVEVIMEWECDSGNPLNHYLFALPSEGKTREIVFDPFRSTSLSLQFDLSLRPLLPSGDDLSQTPSMHDQAALNGAACGTLKSQNSPTINVGPHDIAWIAKFVNILYLPPHKLRTFSRWPRFGVPRIPRSGNLALDKVMTEFTFRIDTTSICIRHMPLDDDDPAKGLTFKMTKLKYEMCSSRSKQKYTFDSFRDPLDLVYQGVDVHMPKVFIDKEDSTSIAQILQINKKPSHPASTDGVFCDKGSSMSGREKHRDAGFLLSSEYFTYRKQAPKADPERILAWQEAGKHNSESTHVKSDFENGSDGDEHAKSDPSDDEGHNAVIADNCQRIFVYGLKILWNIENRDAVRSWIGGLSKGFTTSKPSPSRQYAQRKLLEEKKILDETQILQDDNQKSISLSDDANGADSSSLQLDDTSKAPTSPSNTTTVDNASSSTSPKVDNATSSASLLNTAKVDNASSIPSPSNKAKEDNASSSAMAKPDNFDDSEEDGTRHFMVNVIEPQFNLHSEDANGRFLLAAVSGRVLARSFQSVLKVGYEVIQQAIGTGNVPVPEIQPEMTWSRTELSVMLEHVQAHVAPTDVDLGAGLQWLPKIRKSSPKVKRTGALLERVFMPCDMYFRYTRHKGGTSDLKVKPLKELTFNSHNITASMTSRQFQVMLDVLTNLLFARAPKPQKSRLLCLLEDDEDVEEEADEVVPDGVEEVELAKIELEQKERAQKVILDDIRILSLSIDLSADPYPDKEDDMSIITGGRPKLVNKLKNELISAKKSRKAASASLRIALRKAAQQRLAEKEKNKSPSYAMRLSLKMNKVVWGMLVDGKSFAEAEINDMIYDFDRDYKDIGVVKLTTKYFVVRNCLPNAKCDMLLSAWNPPPEWGKKVMLRVDAKQGAPKEGHSPIEHIEAEIYPLKIHLTETMYRKMWGYLFPEEEQDSQRRQEVWKVSTTAGLKRVKKGSAAQEASSSQSTKDFDVANKLLDEKASKVQNRKANSGSTPELRRTSSFDRTWEENVAESVANELVLQAHSSTVSSSKNNSLAGMELLDEPSKGKSKDSKLLKPGRPEDKKAVKPNDEKKPKRLREFHNIKISQVELSITYEGSRFAVSDLRLLMDTFHRVEFVGTWRRLFSRVKKHVIWSVLKSVTGMQMKKFKDKTPSQTIAPTADHNLSDSDGGSAEKSGHQPVSWPKRPADGAGDGFVTSVRGLFTSQRRKAKAFVLRTMRGDEENEQLHGESENEAEFKQFARQLTASKAKKLIRRHTKKFHTKGHKGLTAQEIDSLPSSPRDLLYDSDSSGSSIEGFPQLEPGVDSP